MPNNSNKKGEALEHAVEMIERVILERNPSLVPTSFKIERKKIIFADGVKHEIDLYITIKHGSGYDSVFIFECKNLKEKASKNDIIVFSEKIKCCKSQKGFFIATGFSRDAENQAKGDNRMELLKANNECDLTPLLDIWVTTNFIKDEKFYFLPYNKSDLIEITLASKIIFKNNPISIKDFLRPIVYKLRDDYCGRDRKKEFKIQHELLYQRRELYIDNVEIANIKIELLCEFTYIKPNIILKFDIKTRGKIIEFEDVSISSEFVLKGGFIITPK